MLKLNYIRSDKVWGYELWLASTHPNGMQKDFYDACGGDYPLLIKIIQANDSLSIQVHPDDDFAVKLEGKGNRGKTECWYILDAEKDAKLVYGIKSGYSKDVLATAIKEKTLENYLEMVSVKKGDFVFIPSGTVHAIGKGIRLMEVQQSCDLTYRLYDWGRDREVHIEKGLAVIKSDEMIPVAPFPGNFDCKYFNLKEINIEDKWSMACPKGTQPKDTRLLYIISSDNATISSNLTNHNKVAINAEEIFAIFPGEKVSVSGKATIMQIIAK
ncbi:MAG: mannose-6-phosphate isomerase [Treponema sp.]|jgi:mannose-6-phosphate isomerase|nr:mannose-6-phosphate isomerase [Treponema sp.]